MIEGILSWAMLFMGIYKENPLYFIASGGFAIAAQIWITRYEGDKER
jgi:hypothetical protein